MSEDKKEPSGESGFKVSDKRHFTPEGEKKPGQKETTETPEPSAETPPAGRNVKSRDAEEKAPRDGTASSGKSVPPDAEPVDFTHLVMYLANIVSFALGVPDPVTKKSEVNLPAAGQMIDLLGILEEKTKGNLTDQEDQILRGIITDLRNVYVKVSGFGTPASK